MLRHAARSGYREGYFVPGEMIEMIEILDDLVFTVTLQSIATLDTVTKTTQIGANINTILDKVFFEVIKMDITKEIIMGRTIMDP